MAKLLTLSGSLRADSYNSKLAATAAELFAPSDHITADLRLPLFDADLEGQDPYPAAVTRLVEHVIWADAIVIASPEYNKAPSGVLKNALDWISRDKRSVLKNKPVAVMSATAGRTGGETGQYMLRACLTPLRPNVLAGPNILIASAAKEFETGTLDNPRYLKSLQELMDSLKAAAQAS
ncbi:MAG: NAD(P)H-dependent oxidoreductase [Thalassovita sp.]